MRRHLLTIAMLLLAGALVNVAVAWGIALSVNPYDSPSDNEFRAEFHSTLLRFSKRTAFGTVHYSCAGRDWEPRRGKVFPEFRDAFPKWASRHEVYTSALSNINGRGWPMLALSASISRTPFSSSPSFEVSWGFETPLPPFSLGGTTTPPGWTPPPGVRIVGSSWPRVLPVRPIWPGFAVNTILYAAILWLPIPGPFVLRRFLRVKRGLCPACAYPMGEPTVCTECGKPLPKRAVA